MSSKTNGRAGERGRLRCRGFTLIEVMVASLITAMLIGSASMSLSQLTRAKSICKERFNAFLRADAALNTLRRDVASVIRSDDLFFTRLLLSDHSASSPVGEIDRDEILLFVTRLRPVRDIDNFNGEGIEYETQYRIEEDEIGPVLWQRRDAFPDEHPAGGGVAVPLVEGVVGLRIQAYDGDRWYDEWDSDVSGLPLAVSITVFADGRANEDDVAGRDPVSLRTVIAMDRVLPPRDIFEAEELALRELEASDEGEGLEGEAAPGDAGELPIEILQEILDRADADDAAGVRLREVGEGGPPAAGDIVVPPGGRRDGPPPPPPGGGSGRTGAGEGTGTERDQ